VPERPVLCFGETLIDLIASDGATDLQHAGAFAARPGGAPANAAVGLARLGVATGFCGVVGADPFGERLRATLAAENVDVSRLRSTTDADTTIAFAWKNERGDGAFRLVRMADKLLSSEDAESARIEATAAIVVGSVALSAEPSRAAINRAVEIAATNGVPICFDVNVRPSLWGSRDDALDACEPILAASTLIKLSLDDGKALFDDVAEPAQLYEKLADFRAPFVVITDGERGAWFVDRKAAPADGLQFSSRFHVDAIDPTGAGDAFTATAIACLIARDWSALTASDVRRASAAGALATTKRGAMEALPTAADIDAFLSSR